jgi:hypothetical protein
MYTYQLSFLSAKYSVHHKFYISSSKGRPCYLLLVSFDSHRLAPSSYSGHAPLALAHLQEVAVFDCTCDIR